MGSPGRAGKFKGYQEDFHCPAFRGFRLLIVTTSQERLANMRQTIDQPNIQDDALLSFFWLTTSDKTSSAQLFQTIWIPLYPANQNLYAIA